MGLIDRFLGREERRASIKSSDPYLSQWFGMRGGLQSHVDVSRASGLAVAHACIGLISQNLAAMPLHLYRRTENEGRAKAVEHPVYGLLHDMADPTMTAFEARELMIATLLTTGNAYAKLTWNGRGQVVAITPLPQLAVSVEQLYSGELRYRVTHPNKGVRVYLSDEILHLRYRLDAEGVMGLSPLALARETFNLGLEQQTQAHKQARHAFRSEGVMSFPHSMSDEAYDRTQAQARQIVDPSQGSSPGIFILDGGAEYKPMTFSPKDGEFLESRKLTNLDVCRVFNVPPTAVGIVDQATYSNVDGESRALVSRCLAPMARRLEAAMSAALLTATARRTYFVEHDLSGLLRGDIQARYEAYAIGRTNGWLSANEIRGWENMSQIDGGDDYMTPMNMNVGGDDAAQVE